MKGQSESGVVVVVVRILESRWPASQQDCINSGGLFPSSKAGCWNEDGKILGKVAKEDHSKIR